MGPAPARRIAIVPVYNEEDTLGCVLQELAPLVDCLILVDDGSRDASAAIMRDWQRRLPGIWICSHRENRGMAQALKTGFFLAERLLAVATIGPEDILINVDADGQHPLEVIPAAAARMESEDLDVLLVDRDFSLYPRFKVAGNRLLSALARAISGFPYSDVESGFRFIRARCLDRFLPFFTGWRYSCAQEIAVITALQGLRIRNDFPVRIRCYRPGTTILDGFAVFVMSFWCLLRVRAGCRSSPGRARDHLAAVEIKPAVRGHGQ